ncbi:MAG TPA: MoaD/ThiS family protein [Gemmatimonadota bacterium]|jgi:sulfur carrier protein ThiS
MTPVVLEVPRMLRDCTEGRPSVAIEADRLGAVREAIRSRWPLLATHVFAESGALRPHVLLLHNDRLVLRGPPDDVRLDAGDRLTIVQAVSGG